MLQMENSLLVKTLNYTYVNDAHRGRRDCLMLL